MRFLQNQIWLAFVTSLSILSLIGWARADLRGAEVERPSSRRLAEHLIERSGIEAGICAVVGGDGDVALEIARITELLVNVRHPERDGAREIMRRADESGYGIRRLAVEAGPLDRLPYADNLIDFVVATEVTPATASHLSVADILRVLRPQGTAIIGAAGATAGAEQLAEWARDGGATDIASWTDDYGSWIHFHKPPLAGADG